MKTMTCKQLLGSVFIFIATLSFSYSQSLITIKQDGTGDYTTIQQGVDAASNGDTVLVYPGIYYENIFYDTISLTIGSLALTTGDPSYISQTIIDGNQSGSCIRIYYSSQESIIYGFTIRNGLARDEGKIGGGIFLFHSKAEIFHCIIEDNIAASLGGGLCSYYSDTYLSGVTIRNNHCYEKGGGLMILASSVVFDSINKCNIYTNFAGEGTDIAKNGIDSIHVIVDTFTIINPDYYYINSVFGSVVHNDITHSIDNGKIDAVSQNLYVSTFGDNNNSGLSINEPLKDIWFALLKMKSDSLDPDTIHIANGIYKNSNGEKFPLSLKGYVSLKGTSREHTILHGENKFYFLEGIVKADHYQISKLSFKAGNGDKYSFYGHSIGNIYYNRSSSFDSIIITDCIHSQRSTRITSSNGFELDHVDFINNLGTALQLGHVDIQFTYTDTVIVRNCIFSCNKTDYSVSLEDAASGGGIFTLGELNNPYLNTVYVFNCLFAENHSKMHPYGGYSGCALSSFRYSNNYVVNCTFTNDTSDNPLGGNIGVLNNSDLYIYNSILYGNYPAELYMHNEYGTSNLNIYNSLIQGGEVGIRIYTPSNNILYDPSNIDTNPMFDTTSLYPFSLSAGSPCIDAGTLNLPPGIELPEVDLAGNPRVHNGYVDMGAYEYGPWVGIDKYNSKPKTQNSKLLDVFPNPFRFETTISYVRPESGQCIIRIYDLNARCIKTLMNSQGLSGKGEMKWPGTNDSGNEVQAGTYIVTISINGKEMDAVKVIKK